MGNKQLLLDSMTLTPQLTESVKELSGGRLRVTGKFQHCDVVNRNRRLYPKKVWEPHCRPDSDFKRALKERRVFGHLEHPANGKPDLNLAAVVITDVELRENGEVWGTLETLSNPLGDKAKSFFQDGVSVGISSRSYGSVRRNNEGIDEVQDDFQPESFDLVAEPSTPGAYLHESLVKEISEKGEGIVEAEVAQSKFAVQAEALMERVLRARYWDHIWEARFNDLKFFARQFNDPNAQDKLGLLKEAIDFKKKLYSMPTDQTNFPENGAMKAGGVMSQRQRLCEQAQNAARQAKKAAKKAEKSAAKADKEISKRRSKGKGVEADIAAAEAKVAAAEAEAAVKAAKEAKTDRGAKAAADQAKKAARKAKMAAAKVEKVKQDKEEAPDDIEDEVPEDIEVEVKTPEDIEIEVGAADIEIEVGAAEDEEPEDIEDTGGAGRTPKTSPGAMSTGESLARRQARRQYEKDRREANRVLRQQIASLRTENTNLRILNHEMVQMFESEFIRFETDAIIRKHPELRRVEHLLRKNQNVAALHEMAKDFQAALTEGKQKPRKEAPTSPRFRPRNTTLAHNKADSHPRRRLEETTLPGFKNNSLAPVPDGTPKELGDSLSRLAHYRARKARGNR